MSTSFKRFSKNETKTIKPKSTWSTSSNKVIVKGTKPWTNGITLTSTGLRELDSIVNNGKGQPLGTMIVIEEDRFLDYGSLIARYWCSEAIAQNQIIECCITKSSIHNSFPTNFRDNDIECEDTGIIKEDMISFLQLLPINLKQQPDVSQRLRDMIIEEDEDNNHGLNIAWQYHTSIQNERLGLSSIRKQQNFKNVFCHSYDLNQHPYDISTFPHTIHFIDLIHSTSKECYHTIIKLINKHLQQHKQVIRILILYPPSHVIKALTSLMYYIKSNSLPIILLVIHRPWKITSQNINVELQQTSDILLQVQRMSNQSSNYEALLQIIKCHTSAADDYYANVTKFVSNYAAYTYKMKLNSRKLELQMLHIPPAGEEDESSGVGSASGGLRSVTRPSCATSLDF